MSRIYACIDLKSFYASVECVERGLDPLITNLVVADNTRTQKTICLAVSPSLKSYGLKGRSRLFEVVSKVKEVNYERLKKIKKFKGKSYNAIDLKDDSLEVDYITAIPRMSYYMKYSNNIYNVYLKYLSKDDIFVYSIDEVFCDITDYLSYYKMTPKELVSKMIQDVYNTTGITATGGIGTNMYLAKVAMDIEAKHTDANEIGVRIAELDEKSYRMKLWNHTPLTDFWRIGRGICKKLNSIGIYTMGDLARYSIKYEDNLFKIFGVNAEFIIDHAWGYEPTTIDLVKAYKPLRNSLSSGQVLHEAYDYKKTSIIVKEMMDNLSLDLTEKHLVTNQIVLTIIYDVDNLLDSKIKYDGDIEVDFYGRQMPKHSHGTINLDYKTSSTKILVSKCSELYERIINKKLMIRKINIAVTTYNEDLSKEEVTYKQLDLFSNIDIKKEVETKKNQIDDNKLQHVMLKIKKKYGKNAILKGMDLEEGATTIDRNKQIGGHRG